MKNESSKQAPKKALRKTAVIGSVRYQNENETIGKETKGIAKAGV